MHAIHRPSLAMTLRALVTVVVAGSALALPLAGPVAAAERSAGCAAMNAYGTQTATNGQSWMTQGTTFTAGEVTTVVFQSDGTGWSGELSIADAGGQWGNPDYATPGGGSSATLTHTYDGTETGTAVSAVVQGGTTLVVTITCLAAAGPTPTPTPTAAPTPTPTVAPTPTGTVKVLLPDTDSVAGGGDSSPSDAPLLLLFVVFSVGVLLLLMAREDRVPG